MEDLCTIVGAGDFTERGLKEMAGYVIAADGGYRSLQQIHLEPDLIVGDFDSLGTIPSGSHVRSFPPEKDDTDMALAVRIGWDRGFRHFRLYGGSGDRLDHFLANLQLIARISKLGGRAVLVCPDVDIYAITNDTLSFPHPRAGTILSVFSHGTTAQGVTLTGVKYLLDQAELSGDVALGVSNVFTGGPASISVQKGTLLVFFYPDRIS